MIKKYCVASLLTLSAFSATALPSPAAEKKAESLGVSKPSEFVNYIALRGGAVNTNAFGGNTPFSAPDTSLNMGLAAGRSFNDWLGAELEYMYYSPAESKDNHPSAPSKINSSWSVRSHTFMLNANVNLIKKSPVVPYLMVGAGLSRNIASTYTYNGQYPDVFSGKTTNKFAWQAGAGLSFMTTDRLKTSIEYRFVNRAAITTKPISTITKDGTLRSNNIMLSLAYTY